MKALLPRFRPFTIWSAPATPKRHPGTHRVEYTRMIDDVIRELLHLEAFDVVISTGHEASETRFDGWPRASAKKPWHPGVSIYFDSKVGPLAFHSDRYTDWQSNLRAIGLLLEALRAVDGQGANESAARYKRYAAPRPLEPGALATAASPLTAAARLLLSTGGFETSPANLSAMISTARYRQSVWRKAVKVAHPDPNSGDGHETFLAVQAAYEMLCGSR